MAIQMKILILLSAGIVSVGAAISQVHFPTDNRLFSQCLDYESKNIIKKGSCECAKQLFPDFNQSYDWMDACAILKEKLHE
jgi:hypothetical protein